MLHFAHVFGYVVALGVVGRGVGVYKRTAVLDFSG